MKRLISIMTVCALVMGTAACSNKKVSGGSSEPETTGVQTNAEVTTTEEITSTTTTTTTTAPLMPPMSQPVEAFKGSAGKGSLLSLTEGADNTLVIKTDNFGGDTCIVFDPVSDKVIREFKLSQNGDDLVGMFSDGTVVTRRDYEKNGVLVMYPKDSDTPREVDLGISYYADMYLDRRNDCIYFKEDVGENILCADANGLKHTQVSSEELLYTFQIFPDSGLFSAEGFSNDTKEGVQSGVYSLKNGALIREHSQDVNICGFTADDLVGMMAVTNDAGMTAFEDIHVMSLSDEDYKVYRMPFEEFASPHLDVSPYSDKALVASFSNGIDGCLKSIHMLDTKTGKLADTKIEIDNNVTYYYACCHEATGRWMIALIKSGYGWSEDSYELLMVDPEMLTYDRQLGEGEKKLPEKWEQVKVGEKYQKVRQRADEIEKKYNVKVYVGNEVKNVEESSQYVLVSTEDSDYYTADLALEYLDGLDDLLGMYPKGFFLHFQSPDGKGGLRISIVDELKNDSFSAFSAGGVAYMTGGWYDIAIMMSSMDKTASSLHHEIWHCVEHMIGRRYGQISDDEWNKMNPSGFVYTQDFDGYITESNDVYKTLSSVMWDEEKDYDGTYFISNYSIVTPMEDRATLIEQLFQCDYSFDPVDGDYPRYGTKLIADYPHLKEKLDYLKKWISVEFTYTYWEEMLK